LRAVGNAGHGCNDDSVMVVACVGAGWVLLMIVPVVIFAICVVGCGAGDLSSNFDCSSCWYASSDGEIDNGVDVDDILLLVVLTLCFIDVDVDTG